MMQDYHNSRQISICLYFTFCDLYLLLVLFWWFDNDDDNDNNNNNTNNESSFSSSSSLLYYWYSQNDDSKNNHGDGADDTGNVDTDATNNKYSSSYQSLDDGDAGDADADARWLETISDWFDAYLDSNSINSFFLGDMVIGLDNDIKLLGMRAPKLRDLIRLAGVHKQVAAAWRIQTVRAIYSNTSTSR